MVTPLPNTDRYESLLEQAALIEGVSLGQDAWRRLRRNRAAMCAFGFLLLVAALSFFCPLLPLQAPKYQDLENRQFKEPNWHSAVQLQVPDPADPEKKLNLSEAIPPLEEEIRVEVGKLEEKLKKASNEEKIKEPVPNRETGPATRRSSQA